MNENITKEEFKEIAQTFITEAKSTDNKLTQTLGLIETRKKLVEILAIGTKKNYLKGSEVRDLQYLKIRVEHDLMWQNKTKKDYKDASEFLNSFVEPNRIEILSARCDELYYAVNWLAKRLNNQNPYDDNH